MGVVEVVIVLWCSGGGGGITAVGLVVVRWWG